MFSRTGWSAVRHEATGQLDEMVECRAIFGEVMPHGLNLTEMRASTLGGSGGMLPREILKI